MIVRLSDGLMVVWLTIKQFINQTIRPSLILALFVYNFIFAAQQVDLFIVQPVKIELINAKKLL